MVKNDNRELTKTTKTQKRVRRFQFKFLAIGFLVISALFVGLVTYWFGGCINERQQWQQQQQYIDCSLMSPSEENMRVYMRACMMRTNTYVSCGGMASVIVSLAFVPALFGILFGIISLKRHENKAKAVFVLNICMVLIILVAYLCF